MYQFAITYIIIWAILFAIAICALITFKRLTWQTMWDAFGICALWFISFPILLVLDIESNHFWRAKKKLTIQDIIEAERRRDK